MNHATLQQVRNPGSSTPTNTMISPIPHLLDVDPFSPFEFSFPKEDFWWDDGESSSMFSDEDYSAILDLDISFTSTTVSESDPIIMPPSPQFCFISPEYPSSNSSTTESSINDFIPKIISSIRQIAPKNVYKRRKFAARRRRHRRKRNLRQISSIEPELRSIFNSVSVGDLFAPSAVSKPPPTSNLPTINLSRINKQMLRRLPDVVYLPVHSCSPEPSFYEKNVPIGVWDTLTSKFWRENPFGTLPSIRTNLGPIPPPTDDCYGYVWTEDGWRVKAERARVPDPGGGHGRGGRDREEDGRRRQIRRK